MEVKTYIKENWLTKNPPKDGLLPTLLFTSFLIISSSIYLNDYFNAPLWMPASFELVFLKHEWWRLWTTLFAHADLSHIASNLFLFLPFSYFLIGYFGYFYFPMIGVLAGGLTNYIVLNTMPTYTTLIGFSGVVNWMGGAWLTLSALIDRRDSWNRRFQKVLAVTIILFVPDSFKEHVSYMSHFIGFFLGVITSLIYYLIFYKKFLKAEVIGVKIVDPYISWYDDYIEAQSHELNALLDEEEKNTTNQ